MVRSDRQNPAFSQTGRAVARWRARQGSLKALLTLTRAWLQDVNDQLAACYDAQNLTADKVEALIDEVSSVKTSLSSFRASLLNVSASLNLTDEEVAAIQVILDGIDDDPSSVEDGLTRAVTDLKATEKRVDVMNHYPTSLVLGAAGIVIGITAIGFAFMRARKSS